MAGGRMYYEAGQLHSPIVALSSDRNLQRGFMDISDFVFPNDPIPEAPIGWVIFGSIIIVLICGITAYFVLRSTCTKNKSIQNRNYIKTN